VSLNAFVLAYPMYRHRGQSDRSDRLGELPAHGTGEDWASTFR